LPGSTLAPHHKTTIHICPTMEYIERAHDDSKYGRPSARPSPQRRARNSEGLEEAQARVKN
jgi:phytoene dehydrogenase-like protein